MNVKTLLSSYSPEDLKRELITRGADTHVAAKFKAKTFGLQFGGHPGLATFSSQEIATELREQQKGIYGVDNRKDLRDVTDPKVLANADSVVSLFRAGRLRDNGDGTSTIQTAVFGKVNSLCSDEPFFSQPVGAFCTGFLVAPDIIATAGHCVNEENVKTVRFVFGFRMLDEQNAQLVVRNSEVYEGASIVGRKLTDADSDWCLVRLNRRVEGRHVLPLRRANRIEDNESVYVIGHPNGLPAKFADGANVRSNSEKAFFKANLDTYGGNSGSPVFNGETHVVEGVLVRGDTDFVPLGTCMISAVCPVSGCSGEDCTRTSEFVAFLP